jgi:hypothetical protein
VDDVTVTSPADDDEVARHADATGVLIIRVWHEDGGRPDGAFRARLVGSLDIEAESSDVAVAANIDDVLAHTRSWLEQFGEA